MSGRTHICTKWTGSVGAGVHLGMADTSAGAHPLGETGIDDIFVAERVTVLQPTVEHPGDDLHVAVGVGLEAAAGRDRVVVVHEQQSVTGVVRVVVRAEAEAVPRVEPTEIRMEAIAGAADVDAGSLTATLHECKLHLERTPASSTLTNRATRWADRVVGQHDVGPTRDVDPTILQTGLQRDGHGLGHAVQRELTDCLDVGR